MKRQQMPMALLVQLLDHQKKTDLFLKSIQRVVIMMGRYVEQVQDIPAGNTCGLVGIDQYIIKTGTVSTSEVAHNFKTMKMNGKAG